MVIIVDRFGRAGNRLAVMAHQIATALDAGYTVVNPALCDYAEWFAGPAASLLSAFPPGRELRLPRKVRSAIYRASKAVAIGARVAPVWPFAVRFNHTQEERPALGEFADVARRRLLLTDGWRYANHEGVERHKAAIRDYLAPTAYYRAAADDALIRARALGDVVIGVHIRQGDLRHKPHPAFVLLETPAYARAMCEAAALLPGRVAFLVCSDDPQSAGAFKGLRVAFGPGTPAGDLYALAGCDRIIGTPSSFSGWASWYGDVPLFRMTKADAAPHPQGFSVRPLTFDMG